MGVDRTSSLDQLVAELGAQGLGIELEITDEFGSQQFEYQCRLRTLRVKADGPISASAGIGHYLRYCAGAFLDWQDLRLPVEYPDCGKTSRQAIVPNRYYLNQVTYGYSTTYWSFERWRQEIRWMALHGITHPAVMMGQEYVWRDVFRRFGVEDEDRKNWIFILPAPLISRGIGWVILMVISDPYLIDGWRLSGICRSMYSRK